MATKNFKGFRLVTKAQFEALGTNKDKDTLYFVRTNEAKSDGFLYFNNKKYGTGADVITKYGELNGKTISAYVTDEIAKVNTAAGELGKKVDANAKAIERINGTGDGSIKKAVSDAKTELIGNDATAGTIKHAEKLATDASTKVDTEIGKLDVTGNVSEAVKGVTVTVDETDGKVIKPVVSIADGTLTGAATDENLVTGKAVKNYVDGEITKVNTAAGTLSGRVDTLEDKVGSKAVEGGAAATGLFKEIAAEITRATAAEEKVKTDLIGDAAAEYNTLGKLEDKIQAETSRAEGVEAQLRTDVDAKVKSVEGTDTVVATTNEHAVRVSLKTSDKGNVKFTQDTDGLSANVTIPKATVTGVKADDKVLALEGTELTSTISLSIDAATGEDGKKYIRLKGINGADLGKIDTADFVKDGMLEKAELVTNPSGQTEGTYIVLTWNTAAGKEAMPINVTSLIDVYTAGNGLNLSDHEFSVDTTKIATKASVEKLNATHAKDGENFKTVATEVSEGIAGIAETSKASAEGEGEADVKVTVTTKSGSVSAVAVDSSRLAQKVTNNTDAITKLNGNDTVDGSVDKKIKDALEKGAVTLEVKDNDAYLGVTSTTGSNGTVYTLASKEAAINEAIKNAADAVKVSVASAEGAYVTASVDAAGRAITLSEKVQSVESSSASAKGLAEASDVKAYVDGKVSSKNVSATGDTYVSATAADNKVTVGATEALTSAVGKANSAVQSVNGVAGTAVVIKATDIEVGAGVSGQTETATVNAVLADIYSKIGAVKVSSQLKTITVDEETGRIIDVHCQTVPDAQEAGHVALEHGEDGALYGVMYYSGDDIDA